MTNYIHLEQRNKNKSRYTIQYNNNKIFKDRGIGRRIISFFPDQELEKTPLTTLSKIVMYISFVVGYDIEAQQQGCVGIQWVDPSFQNNASEAALSMHVLKKRPRLLSTRMSEIHICTPNTPYYLLQRNVVVLGQYRQQLKMHVGSPVELHTILTRYGIPVENIPITASGNIKNIYLREWMNLRLLIESNCNESPLQHNNYNNTMIECPYLTDILFQRGTGTLQSPNVGNVKLRHIIEAKTIEYGCFDRYMNNNHHNYSDMNSSSNSLSVNSNHSATNNRSANNNEKKKNNNILTRKALTTLEICVEILKEIRKQMMMPTTTMCSNNNLVIKA